MTVAVATTTPPPNNLPQTTTTETTNNSNTTTAPSPIPDPSPTPSVTHAPTVATLWTETLKAAEDQAIAISGFSVDDVDGDRLTVTLTATSTLTLASTDGLDFLVGDGTADETMTFSGSAAAITAALNGLTYTPSPDFSGIGHISYQVSDGTNTTSGNVGIDITPVNDPPALTGDLTATVAEGGSYVHDRGRSRLQRPGRRRGGRHLHGEQPGQRHVAGQRRGGEPFTRPAAGRRAGVSFRA